MRDGNMIYSSDDEFLYEQDAGSHASYMRVALAEAQAAMEENEVPVGAIIVRGAKIIAAAHNQREQLRDPTAHAEMIAITQAAESIGSWRLEQCVLGCRATC